MAGADFQLTYERLALTPTEAKGAVDETITSAPRAPVVQPSPASTLPQLDLAMPIGAQQPGTDGPELVALNVLGEGGMGTVLLARQHSLGREVAVKVLKPGVANQAAANALIEEARTTGSLEHPGVVPIYALARDAQGLPALVMKRIEGVSWRELIQNKNHPAWENVARGRDRLEANLEILIQVCNAIAHAHKRGVIHRDIKPANILIGELGEVYVADWGVAFQKAVVKGGPRKLVGTPAYLAPEMVTGDPAHTDERTDVYLLGGTLYEVLNGAPPHRGETIREVLAKAWEAAPPSFSKDVPIDLARLCTTALSAKPDARFQTVLELRDAVRLFIASRDSTRLVEEATTRLKILESLATSPPNEADDRRWYSLLSEARFAFRQALETHALSDGARQGLKRCLEIAARRELDRGTAAAARAFLAELKNPPAELVEGLRLLEEKDARRLDESAKFQKMAFELSPSVHGKQRTAVIVGLALSICGSAAIVYFFFDEAFRLFGKAAPILPLAAIFLVYLALIVIGRRTLLSTRLNRQLSAVAGVCTLCILVSRSLSVWMDVPLSAALTFEGVMLAGMMTVCAFVWHWGLFVPAIFFLLGGLACVVVPGRAVDLYTVGTGVAVASAAVMLRRWRKDSEGDHALR
jgi:eukaryotic-like serine/threonine-protein kinase